MLTLKKGVFLNYHLAFPILKNILCHLYVLSSCEQFEMKIINFHRLCNFPLHCKLN